MLPVHVMLAVDPRCAIGCAVTMQSIADNATAGVPIHFHVVTSGISEADRDALHSTTNAMSGRHVQVSFSEFDPASVAHLTRSKIVTRTAYASLFLADVLPPAVTRCVYVDCDLVFERDIVELWDTDLNGCCIGAVRNGSAEEDRRYQQRLSLATPTYFNSGVLLVDVDKWRRTEVGPRALAEAARVGDHLILHDQDALNCALHGDWLPLPLHWNVWVIHPELKPGDRAVRHYMGAPKPWHADYTGPYADRFHSCLDRTAYRGWRPWNPGGIGSWLARLRRGVPYLPSALRIARLRLSSKDRTPRKVLAG
jgi:lipopolysaccharide biosynthesis glycosyltransferase